ncbi:MAG: hypothetical protein ACRBCS_16070 [Cellvibrionaceae bacterium]
MIKSIAFFVFGGALSLVLTQVAAPSLFDSVPEKGSFEALSLCNNLSNQEEKIEGDDIDTWVTSAVIEKFSAETAFWPESAKTKFYSEAEPYMEVLRSGTITQRAIANLAYLHDQAKPTE